VGRIVAKAGSLDPHGEQHSHRVRVARPAPGRECRLRSGDCFRESQLPRHGHAELDEVAIKYANATSFRTNCTYAPMLMTIAVE
jgi:hypothetical protein